MDTDLRGCVYLLRDGTGFFVSDLSHDPTIKLTRNRMGWSSETAHEVNLAFAEYAGTCKEPVLDLGAGFGVATIAALRAGAVMVVANDLDHEALQSIDARIPVSMRDRFQARPGRFPAELEFAGESLGAIHASNVLHFLDPTDFETGIAKMFDWLVPNGTIFVMVNSTFIENFKDFIPHFLQRKGDGEKWPGWVENLTEHTSHPTLQYLPPSLHLFDAEILSRAFTAGGFTIDVVKEFRRSGLPESLWYDGRENVVLIGRK